MSLFFIYHTIKLHNCEDTENVVHTLRNKMAVQVKDNTRQRLTFEKWSQKLILMNVKINPLETK